MNKKDNEVIMVVLDRFNKQRLPRALAMKEKVERGDLLDGYDIKYIDDVQKDGGTIKQLVDRNPEYKDLVSKAMNLWSDIIEMNIQNQKKRKKK